MRLYRLGALAAVLLTASACSQLPMGPTAYSALPSGPPVSVPPPAAARVQPDADVALAPVVIPGTWKLPNVGTRPGSVNPSAVLEASVRTRMAWKVLHPEVLSERRAPVARSFGADVTETAATSSATTSPATSAADRVPANYNREALMSTLLKGGKDAARSICSGC